jgi:hypothetical protein
MAGLTHRKNVAKRVGSTGGQPVDFPFASQRCITAAGVVRARLHRTLAPTARPIVYIISKGQVPHLLSFWVWVGFPPHLG